MERSKKQDFKFLKAATAVAVAASAVTVVAPLSTEASSLSDIKPSQYFYKDVVDLHTRGIIRGFPDGTFKPNKKLTRGQAAKIIAGVLELDTKNVVDPKFKDIPKTHQYYGAIAALKQAGIIDGYGDGAFRPGANIQRNHVAKILTKALNLKKADVDGLPFTDVQEDYKEAIAALYEKKIITGKTLTTFDGTSNVTRGQMAAFIVRAEKAVAEQGSQAQNITFKVADYTDTAITVEGKDYSYDAAVTSIFTEANKAALIDATVTATVEDGVIKKVTSVALNHAGTKESALLFDTKASIVSLVINANYVAVKNVNVTESATITSNVNSEVLLDGVNIAKDLVMDNAVVGTVASLNHKFAQTSGNGAKIKLVNTILQALNVKRDNISIESNTTIPEIAVAAAVQIVNVDGTVSKMMVESISKLEIRGNATVAELVLATLAELALNIAGKIEKLIVANPKAKVTVGTTVRVNELSLPAGITAATIIHNYSSVVSQIASIIIGGVPASQPQLPSTDSGSGTGGSSESGSGGGNTGGQTPGDRFTATTNNGTLNDQTTLGLVGTSAASSATSVAKVAIDNGKIAITSVSAGTAIITVKNAENHEATIAVTVAANGAITLGSIVKYVSPPVVTPPVVTDLTAYNIAKGKMPASNADGKYTATSWTAYEAALVGVALNLDKNAGQAAVNTATAAINAALAKLVEKESVVVVKSTITATSAVELSTIEPITISYGEGKSVGATVASTREADSFKVVITFDNTIDEGTKAETAFKKELLGNSFKITISDVTYTVTADEQGQTWTLQKTL